ncbi:SpoIIE family protein phosphatase [Thermospira aquatica]|uniref:SpoIIE family protein phosphatase n=1 Tax=Thermospira aquatica TaxID=2828656 RepID=A0AAX3BCA5_9SPIR|nr:SpoIIE family protein phosphatase [Thermospira aquatica]URA09765.1 SpoIIE family protein phosphatase [Thermospira aquatica]
MLEIAWMFLIAFVLVVLALEMLVINFRRMTVAAALWLGILAFYALMTGLKVYLAELHNFQLLYLFQRLEDALWVHQPWIIWFFMESLLAKEEKKNLSFPFIVLFGISSIFSLVGLGGGLYDSLYLSTVAGLVGMRTQVVLVPSVMRVLALMYTGITIFFAIFKLFLSYFSVPYAFQQRWIRYLLAAVIIVLLDILFVRTEKIGLSLRMLGILWLGGWVFYIVSAPRALGLRERFSRFSLLALFGLVMMLLPGVIFYIFRTWFMTLFWPVFVLIFASAMALYFVFCVMVLMLFRKISKPTEFEEDRLTFFLKKLVQKKDRYGFAEELVFLLKEWLQREVDVIENNDGYLSYLSSTRSKSGRMFFPEVMQRYLETGDAYVDREMVLSHKGFRKDVGVFFEYFDKEVCEALLLGRIEGKVRILIQLGPNGEGEGLKQREIRELKSFLRIIELLYQNVLFFEREEENEQTKRELALASEIQETLFQRETPKLVGLDVAFYQEPAKWLSGDYLWLDAVSSKELSFVVADVSGKGVSAALITMMIHSVIQGYHLSSSTVHSLLAHLNVMLSKKKSREEWRTLSFATVFVGFIDTQIQMLYYSNAGHYPLLIWDLEKREFLELSTPGKPVGLFENSQYVTETYNYETDQIFVVYSDGITECLNQNEEEFGIQRLKRIIQKYDYLSASEIRDKVLEEIQEFRGGADIYDDMTLLVLKT